MPQPSTRSYAPALLEPLLAQKNLNSQTFGAIYERGIAYELDGYVKSVSLTPSSLSARVAGSHGASYEVSLTAEVLESQPHALIIAFCSCPFATGHLGSESFCKHIVAAAIAGRRLYAIERESQALLGACAPRDTSDGSRRNGPRI